MLCCYSIVKRYFKNNILYMENFRSDTIKEEGINENCRELELFGGFPNNSEKYESNEIISSRFTLWNVVPKSIFEQFLKYSNL